VRGAPPSQHRLGASATDAVALDVRENPRKTPNSSDLKNLHCHHWAAAVLIDKHLEQHSRQLNA